jgi:uncharacterized phiE125 gp8 family phage protein
MSLTLIMPPALEPVTLAQAKLHLRVDGTDEDTLITSLIVAARRQAEHELRRALITQTWELTLDDFPAGDIQLPMPAVLSIVSVKYLDSAGAEQTVSSADYSLDAATSPGWVLLADDATWPTPGGGANCVKVRFTAGYGPAAADVPANVVAYMLLQIGAMYKHRESFAAGVSVAELPNRFTASLLDSERAYL